MVVIDSPIIPGLEVGHLTNGDIEGRQYRSSECTEGIRCWYGELRHFNEDKLERRFYLAVLLLETSKAFYVGIRNQLQFVKIDIHDVFNFVVAGVSVNIGGVVHKSVTTAAKLEVLAKTKILNPVGYSVLVDVEICENIDIIGLERMVAVLVVEALGENTGSGNNGMGFFLGAPVGDIFVERKVFGSNLVSTINISVGDNVLHFSFFFGEIFSLLLCCAYYWWIYVADN